MQSMHISYIVMYDRLTEEQLKKGKKTNKLDAFDGKDKK